MLRSNDFISTQFIVYILWHNFSIDTDITYNLVSATTAQDPADPCFRQVVIPQMRSAASTDSDGNRRPQIQISTRITKHVRHSRWEIVEFTLASPLTLN